MNVHLRPGLVIVLGAAAILAAVAPTAQAQVDVDRVLARVFEEWKEGSTAPPPGVMDRLSGLGADAAPAVPLLIAALRSKEPAHRIQAIRTLMAIGPAARPAVPELTALLQDPDQNVRQTSTWALSSLGKTAETTIPALVQALRAGPERRDFQAVWPLVNLGEPALPALIELLKEPDPALRKAVVEGLARVSWTHRLGRRTTIAVKLEPLLVSLAQDPDLGVRIAVMNLLSFRRKDSGAAIAALQLLSRDPNPAVRLALVRALGQTGMLEASLRPAYLTLLKDPDRDVRIQAATWVPYHDLAAPTFIDALLEMLKDPAIAIRTAAAQKLSQAHYSQQFWKAQGQLALRTYTSAALVRSPTAFAVLKSALADPEPSVRATAATLLPIWKAEAATLIPLLTDRLKDPVANVRGQAAAGLVPFGPAVQGATRSLLAVLANPGGTANEAMPVAASAARALEAIGGPAKDKMLRILLSQLNALDQPTRNRAIWVVQNLGNKLGQQLFRTFTDPRTPRRVQIELMSTLYNQIGQPPRPESLAMTPILRTLARDEEPQVSQTAIGLLSYIDPHCPEVVDTYFASLRDGQNKQIVNQWPYHYIKPEMIPRLIPGLRDDNPEVRMGAARALAFQAERLVQYRKQDLSDKSRSNAVLAATRELRGRLAVQSVHALLTALKDPDVRIRWIATFALGVLETEAETVVPILIEMAKNATERVPSGDMTISFRPFADRDQYYFLGPSQKGGDPLRIAAMQALGSFGSAASPAVPGLVAALRDPDLRIRWFAAEALALIGPSAKAAVPALIEALRSRDVAAAGVLRGNGAFMFGAMEDGPIRLIAAEALGRIGPSAKAAIPDLIAAVSGPDSRVRSEAARALGGIGPDAAAAIPELLRILTRGPVARSTTASRPFAKAMLVRHRNRGHVALSAQWSQDALVQIGAAAVPPLLEVLRDDDPEARIVAIETLGKFGTKATAAIPQLITGLNDPEPRIRTAAAQALSEIAPAHDTVIPALIALLRNPDDDVSNAACNALVRLGKSSYPAVLRLTRDDDPDVRKMAVTLLSFMASPGFAFAGESPDQMHDRSQAVRAALRTALGDRDDRVRSGASAAWQKVGESVVPDLVAALDDASPTIRSGAARTLEALGNGAREALGALRRHQNDADPEVRQAIDSAIRTIDESEHFEVVTLPGDP